MTPRALVLKITAPRLAALLIVVHILAFSAGVLASDLSFAVWRGAGFATVGLAFISGIVGLGLVGIGLVRRRIDWLQAGAVLLFVNVLPYVVLIILTEMVGIP